MAKQKNEMMAGVVERFVDSPVYYKPAEVNKVLKLDHGDAKYLLLRTPGVDGQLTAPEIDQLINLMEKNGAGAISPAIRGTHKFLMVGPNETASVPFALMDTLLIRTDTLAEVGLLREDVFTQGWGADIEWCHRVRLTGRMVWVAGAATLTSSHQAADFPDGIDAYKKLAKTEMQNGLVSILGDGKLSAAQNELTMEYPVFDFSPYLASPPTKSCAGCR